MHGDKETALAVDGQGIYFYFDRKNKVPVLNDVNIAVPRGRIYSLLGPSGCGKTTLLKCIIGQHKLREGSLKVYGRTPGSKGFPIPGRGIGYMPQELGLYFDMSIEEIMIYFGSLYCMNRKLIDERTTFLVELLALPEKKRMIKNLSGGQQRRVSFAIALIHTPPLLILDEPTVGVDPLLRQNIWDHLVALAKNEHLTIIITTHYTEEARQADIAGMMRNGHLMLERNPEDLIKQYEMATLEAVFLKLCQEAGEEKDQGNPHNLTSVESCNPKSSWRNGFLQKWRKTNERFTEGKHSCQNGKDFKLIAMDTVSKGDDRFIEKNNVHDNKSALLSSSSLPKEFADTTTLPSLLVSFFRFMCLTRKNFLRLKRNIFYILFSIFLPTAEVVIFCMCLASNPFDLRVSVVNKDEDLNKFGEYFLNSLNNRTIHQIKYDNLSEAYQSVKRGESWAALYIGTEFSECLVDRILEGGNASNDTLQCSMVSLYLDNSNYVIATTIFVDLLNAYLKCASELLTMYGKSHLLAESPVKIEEYVYGKGSASAIEFIAPGVIVAIAYIITIALTLICVLEEKKLGLFERTFVAGATATEVLMSQFFVLLAIVFFQNIAMLICAFYGFSIPYNGPFFWIFFGIMVVGISGMSYGFLISTVTDELATGIIIAVGSFIPTLFLSAIIWPVEAMPQYLRYFSQTLPLTKIIESMRSMIIRGWSISEYNIWDGFLICSSWTVLSMILSIAFFKFKK